MGAAAVPLIMTAVGTGMQMYNTKQTEERQRNALNLQLQQQEARDREAQALVADTLRQTAGSNPDAARASAMDQYMQGIQRAQGTATRGLDQVGAVSDRYTQDADRAAADIYKTSAQTAGQLASIDAPLSQRMTEGIRFNRLGSDIGLVANKAAGDDYVSRIRLQRAGQRDPWLDALGSAAQSYGMSGGGFGRSANTGPELSGPSSLLGRQASTGQGSIYNFGNNVDDFWRWRG